MTAGVKVKRCSTKRVPNFYYNENETQETQVCATLQTRLRGVYLYEGKRTATFPKHVSDTRREKCTGESRGECCVQESIEKSPRKGVTAHSITHQATTCKEIFVESFEPVNM